MIIFGYVVAVGAGIFCGIAYEKYDVIKKLPLIIGLAAAIAMSATNGFVHLFTGFGAFVVVEIISAKLCEDSYPASNTIRNKSTTSQSSTTYLKDKELCHVTVKFDGDTYGRAYHYICDDWHVKTGDSLTVPTLNGNKTAKLIFRKVYKSSEVPYPLHLTTKVISIISENIVSQKKQNEYDEMYNDCDTNEDYEGHHLDKYCDTDEQVYAIYDDDGNVERYIRDDKDYAQYLSDHGYHDDDAY